MDIVTAMDFCTSEILPMANYAVLRMVEHLVLLDGAVVQMAPVVKESTTAQDQIANSNTDLHAMPTQSLRAQTPPQFLELCLDQFHMAWF